MNEADVPHEQRFCGTLKFRIELSGKFEMLWGCPLTGEKGDKLGGYAYGFCCQFLRIGTDCLESRQKQKKMVQTTQHFKLLMYMKKPKPWRAMSINDRIRISRCEKARNVGRICRRLVIDRAPKVLLNCGTPRTITKKFHKRKVEPPFLIRNCISGHENWKIYEQKVQDWTEKMKRKRLNGPSTSSVMDQSQISYNGTQLENIPIFTPTSTTATALLRSFYTVWYIGRISGKSLKTSEETKTALKELSASPTVEKCLRVVPKGGIPAEVIVNKSQLSKRALHTLSRWARMTEDVVQDGYESGYGDDPVEIWNRAITLADVQCMKSELNDITKTTADIISFSKSTDKETPRQRRSSRLFKSVGVGLAVDFPDYEVGIFGFFADAGENEVARIKGKGVGGVESDIMALGSAKCLYSVVLPNIYLIDKGMQCEAQLDDIYEFPPELLDFALFSCVCPVFVPSAEQLNIYKGFIGQTVSRSVVVVGYVRGRLLVKNGYSYEDLQDIVSGRVEKNKLSNFGKARSHFFFLLPSIDATQHDTEAIVPESVLSHCASFPFLIGVNRFPLTVLISVHLKLEGPKYPKRANFREQPPDKLTTVAAAK
ncbi:unnamed protein product [Litomosoides sigmodontis]|uniref:Uncharacterized protein n=1 Tax=Litomosoides sigmodontis TaxID=42156 RepID=A0A3P6SA54_LITSI|nr:unnamed protein product [Litomosoides sigmodontis]